LVVLSLSERTLLIDLCATDPDAAEHIVDRLRSVARSTGWINQRADRINFRRFFAIANERKNADAQAQRTSGKAADASRREGTGNEGATAEDMLDQDESTYLIALGHLMQNFKGRIWFDTFHLNYFTNWDGEHTKPLDEAVAWGNAQDGQLMTWLHLQDPRLG